MKICETGQIKHVYCKIKYYSIHSINATDTY